MKFIAFVLGIVIGGAGGIWYGVANPKAAADLNAKREEWQNQAKAEVLKQVNDALSKKLADAQAAPATPGRGFAGPMGSGGGKSEAEALKEAKSVVEAKLVEVQAKK